MNDETIKHRKELLNYLNLETAVDVGDHQKLCSLTVKIELNLNRLVIYRRIRVLNEVLAEHLIEEFGAALRGFFLLILNFELQNALSFFENKEYLIPDQDFALLFVGLPTVPREQRQSHELRASDEQQQF